MKPISLHIACLAFTFVGPCRVDVSRLKRKKIFGLVKLRKWVVLSQNHMKQVINENLFLNVF